MKTLGNKFTVGTRSGFFLVVLMTGCVAVSACKKVVPSVPSETQLSDSIERVHRVKVQHILVAFEGSLSGKTIKRSQVEAEKLANEVLTKAKTGAEFELLVKEFSDDRSPGIYSLADEGIALLGDEIPRSQMALGFGDMSFSLKVNEIGFLPYEKTKSPFGFHIIKRLE